MRLWRNRAAVPWAINLSYLFLVLLMIGGLVTAVSAHDAVITRSTPANGEVLDESPAQVVAWFAEELMSGDSTIAVFDAQGQQRDNGDGGVDLNDPDHASMVVSLPPLPDGSYTVQWHAVLLDGDASDGAFAFAVGQDQTVQPVAATAVDTGGAGFSGGTWLIALGLAAVILFLLFFFVLRRRSA